MQSIPGQPARAGKITTLEPIASTSRLVCERACFLACLLDEQPDDWSCLSEFAESSGSSQRLAVKMLSARTAALQSAGKMNVVV